MRVLISDARQSVRNALQLLLRQTDTAVIDTASTAEELVKKTNALHPDLILLDWELDEKFTGKMLVGLLGALDYRPFIITLSIRPEARMAALTAGSDAFISKTDPGDQVLQVLEAVIHPAP